MILTIEEVRQYITTSEADSVLVAKLQALELLIRKYTNNNFQQRAYRTIAECRSEGKVIECDTRIPFKAGDTIQISQSKYMNDTLITIKTVSNTTIVAVEDIVDEDYVLLTKVVYPMDVKMGVVNMLKWDLDNRDKIGIQSETISRHSVTYFNMDAANSSIGYPTSLVGFLKPYIKARF